MIDKTEFIDVVLKGILIGILCVAAVSDVRTGKIRNRLTMTGIAVGWLGSMMRILVSGEVPVWKELLWRNAGIVAAFAVALIPYILGMVKAGDVKLMWVVGAFQSFSEFVNSILWGILAGGAAAVFYLLWKRDLFQRLKHIGLYLKMLFMSRSYQRYQPEEKDRFPFAVPILLGVILGFLKKT